MKDEAFNLSGSDEQQSPPFLLRRAGILVSESYWVQKPAHSLKACFLNCTTGIQVSTRLSGGISKCLLRAMAGTQLAVKEMAVGSSGSRSVLTIGVMIG